MAVFWSFFLLISAISSENATSDDFSTPTPSVENFTYDFMDYEATTESTTATPSGSSTEEPGRPVEEPLPASGRLLSPLNRVDSWCPCDHLQDVCDVSCCCDRECKDEVALFTSCSVSVVRGGKQLCSHDVAYYSLRDAVDGYSELQSSVQKEANYDIFCIQSYNRVDGLSHPSPALPTESNFESLFKQFSRFMFSSESSDQLHTADVEASSGYQYGDVILTARESRQRGTFHLPTPGLTADCVNNNPAAFLKDQRSLCSQRMVVDRDCNSLPSLSMDTYANIQLFSGKNTDAVVVPVEVVSVVLQSIEGTLTELSISAGETLRPVLLNSTLCANVVLKALYMIKYNSAGEVVDAAVSLVLGFVPEATVTLQQDFQVTYIQDDKGAIPVRYSGNPGYVVGLPLVSGTRTTDGIIRSINLRDTLSLLHSAEDQDCLQAPHQRSPVLFGLDSVSGCMLRLESAANCSLVSQLLLNVLRGSNYPDYVSSFGNSLLENPLEWVQIHKDLSSMEAQDCNIPLSLHLEIKWTKYGTLVNPQAQIVSIKEVIQTNTSSLALLSGGSSILSVRSSVAFIPVSANALPGYRATPTIDAKLPFDFFFPFV